MAVRVALLPWACSPFLLRSLLPSLEAANTAVANSAPNNLRNLELRPRANRVQASKLSMGRTMQSKLAASLGRFFAEQIRRSFMIQRPIYVSFLINMTTAKLLQLTIPPSLAALADEVIE
jgi:hypothetical protein